MGQPQLKVRMTSATPPPPTPAHRRLVVADRYAALRPSFETFLQTRYSEAFDARLNDHYPLIAGLTDAAGRLSAAAGVRFAEDEPLFLEHYLDQPVEVVLGPIHGEVLGRDDIVEIGSLASRTPMATMDLFSALAGWMMSGRSRRFAVATVTPRLQSLLGRAGFQLTRIADADPARVACAEHDWGSYYRGGPSVVTGRIGLPPEIADLGAARQGRQATRAAR